METLLEKIRKALKNPYEFVVLKEHEQNLNSEESNDLQTFDIAIAPTLGIYRLKAEGYWTENGKNLPGWDYCWGHWTCPALDRLNNELEYIFSPVAAGTIQEDHYFGKYEEGKGLRFRFEPGDLQPAKADRVEKIERIQGWFEGKGQPDTLFLPHAVATEIVGVAVEKSSTKYCLFPSYTSEIKAKKDETSSSTTKLERTITITCYPSREFYEEKEKIQELRNRLFGKGRNVDQLRKKDRRYRLQLEDLGVILENPRAIHIPKYNDHFKEKPNFYH